MEPFIHVQSHVQSDGVLHIEGLHQMADQEVTVLLTPISGDVETPFELEKYAASVTGKTVADRLKAVSRNCSSLPVLDERTAEDILGYNDLGLPD